MARGRPIVVLLACLFSSARADAHLGHVVLRAERYIKLDVAGSRARLVVSLTLGSSEGRRILEAADADRDSIVSARERDEYLAQWAAGLATELPVSVDGERIPLTWAEPYMEPIGAVRDAPLTIEMIAHFALAGREVRIEDRMVRREVFDRTDVAFRARDGARLVASGEGEPNGTDADLAYEGSHRPGEPVLLSAAFETPRRSWPWWHVAGSFASVFAIVAGVIYLRRWRARRWRQPV